MDINELMKKTNDSMEKLDLIEALMKKMFSFGICSNLFSVAKP